jgi:hypothetical protein
MHIENSIEIDSSAQGYAPTGIRRSSRRRAILPVNGREHTERIETMYTTTIIRNPNNSFSVVGSVPETCLATQTPPTYQQAMAGRCYKIDGIAYGWERMTFESVESALTAIVDGGIPAEKVQVRT